MDRRLSRQLGGSDWQRKDIPESGRTFRAQLDAEFGVSLGATQLRMRSIAAAVSGGFVPVQDLVRFGGPTTAPGYDFHALVRQFGVSQRVELQRRIPFVPINLGRFGRVPATLLLAPFVHAAWMGGAATPGSSGDAGWHPAVGLGTIGFFDLLRVDVARGLRDGRWTFSLDVGRTLWPVL